MKRNWLACGTAALAVIALGLASRRYAADLPWWVGAYVGDALWALMLYLILGTIARWLDPWRLALVTLAVAYGVECSQLYHAPWIDDVRRTHLGGLVFGYGFLWSDLACYTAGVSAGYAAECAVRRWRCRAPEPSPSAG
jgi:hypothetical protein